MMHRPTSRRPGASLVEVLVGFGILGIGVTSVITLFPFSALTIGQALKDDRTTTCGVMADGLLRDLYVRYVVDPEHDKLILRTGGTTESFFWSMDNPSYDGAHNDYGANPLPALSSKDAGPSYPVFLDPMGYVAGRKQLGDGGEALIPRASLQMIGSNQAMALRYCSLMDSLTYNEDGQVPSATNMPVGMRELRYNFAWMVQRPTNRDRFTVRMQVIVYNKRAHLYSPPGSEVVFSPASDDSSGPKFAPGETSITLVPGNAEIRKGMWVMDAGRPEAPHYIRQAEFYRVVSVTPVGGTLAVEVHKPIVRADGKTGQYRGRLVVMPGVADVFDRPNLTGNTSP